MTPFNHQKAQEVLERIAKRTIQLPLSRSADIKKAKEMLVKVMRLAALIGVVNPPTERIIDETNSLADTLKKQRTNTPRWQQHLSDTLDDLNAIKSMTQAWLMRRRAEKKPRRADFKVDYFMLEETEACYLVEDRHERNNFRVSDQDYQAVVAALADATNQPRKFGELYEMYVKHGGQDVSSQYPLRVVLRYFRTLDPPLVVKKGVKYAPATDTKSGFRQEAAKAWRALGIMQQP